MDNTSIEIGSLIVDRYRVEATLGAGGMSTVYRARDETLGRTVAIKVFRDSLSDAKAVQRQRSEVQLVASFEHPSLVTLFDAVVLDEAATNEHAFLVMQFVDGDDLRALLTSGPVEGERALAIAADVADALAYIHDRGVIHRDVKPGNILLPRAARATGPHALLADFGIARFVDGLALTATGSVLGTANYLSPEQALGGELTAATDIYSLGLVLIETLSGVRAFPGRGLESVAARLSADPVPPAGVSAELAALLTAMTDRDPSVRPTAARVREGLRGMSQTVSAPLTAQAEPDATILMGAPERDGYAPTAMLPSADSMPTTQLGGRGSAETSPSARSPLVRRLVSAAIVLVALLAVLLAIVIPLATRSSTPVPASSPTSPSPAVSAQATSATTTRPTTASPKSATPTPTPTTSSAVPIEPVEPTHGKPGKGNNGNGHGKKP